MQSKFSKNFRTYEDWEKQAENTGYAKRVKRMHALHPTAKLYQLQGKPVKGHKALSTAKRLAPIWRLSPDILTPREKRLRRLSLDVINRMREKKLPLSQASRMLKVRPKVVLRHAGGAVRKRRSGYFAKHSDKVSRAMKINSGGQENVVYVDSENASVIGRYQNAKKKYLQEGDDTELQAFESVSVKDIHGREYVLDTDTAAIEELEERREEPEFYEIYAD